MTIDEHRRGDAAPIPAERDARLVTVIMPVLNLERFLDEAIASVVAQTYERWELLVVDDGSRDASPSLARAWARRDPRIRCLAHPGGVNRGVSATRNLGLRHARGGFVGFLDGDDVWRPAKLAEQVAILDAHPRVAAVYGPTEWWWSWAGPEQAERPDRIPSAQLPVDRIYEPPTLFRRMFLDQRAPTPATCSILIRHEAFDRVGGFVDQFRDMFEDQAFYGKLLLHESVYLSGQCWDRYRKHPDSCCARSSQAGADARHHHRFLEWLASYLDGQGYWGTGMWWQLQALLDPYRHPWRHWLAALPGRIDRKARRLARWIGRSAPVQDPGVVAAGEGR